MQIRTILYPKISTWLALGLALLVIGAAFGWVIENDTGWGDFWFRENGPVEEPQVLVLVLAAALFAVRFWRSRGPVAAWCVPIVFLLFLAMLRETPRCDSLFYPGGTCLTGHWKEGLQVGASLITLGLLFHRRADVPEMLRPRWSFVFWPLGIAVILLAIGETAERLGSEAIEESLEFAAYFYTVALAAWVLRRT